MGSETYGGEVPGWTGPLKTELPRKRPLMVGLRPNSQRYFDYHHSERDVFENVHPRELKLGAAALTSMVYLLDQLDYDSLTNPKTDMRHSISDTSTLLLDRRSISPEKYSDGGFTAKLWNKCCSTARGHRTTD